MKLSLDGLKERIEKRYPTKTRKVPYGRVPFGYYVSPDPLVLLPDVTVISYLEEAFDLIEGGTPYREVTPWLQEVLLSPLTFQTVNNLYNRHRKPFARYKTNRNPRPDRLKPTKLQKQIAGEKRSITRALSRLSELEKKKGEKEKEKEKETSVPASFPLRPTSPKTADELTSSVRIVFQPNPGPQEDFLAASEQEVLYGGAAGGGKSYALLADPMRYFHMKDFRGLLVRRTNDELRELKQKSQELYKPLFPGAKWSASENTWTFPSGATLWMTYLERDEDVHRYQGMAFTWIGFDELTHWATPFAWNYLRSRLRTTNPDVPLAMRATTNPGGIGHHWVKKMFIDPSAPNLAFPATDIDTGEPLVYPSNHKRSGEPLFYRKFIPASLYDNPYLLQDGQYEQNLLSLSEAQRQKLLYGNWDIMEGAAFPEFSRSIHVIEPFEIPDEWRKFRACDYGYASYHACLWFAIDPGDRLYVYRELYATKMAPSDLAFNILRSERKEKIQYGVLDSSVWAKRGEGPSPAEEMIALGCRWRPADRSPGSRQHGFTRLHELLKLNDLTDQPGIFIFNTCRQLITDLPSLPLDPDGKDDIDQDFPSDHTYDALRYGIMSRPRSLSPFESWSNQGNTANPARREADPVFGY